MLRTLDPALAQKSMDWARARLVKAAEAGDDDALVALARSFAPPFGMENEIEAYFYSCLAVSVGKAEARRQRDAIVPRLKQADLLKTQQRANDWFQKHRRTGA